MNTEFRYLTRLASRAAHTRSEEDLARYRTLAINLARRYKWSID